MPTFAAVILDSAIDKALDYAIPAELEGKALPGTRVLVPVRGSLRKGTILNLKEKTDFPNVRDIATLAVDEAFVSPDLFALAGWLSRYYCVPLRKALKSILPPSIRGAAKPKTQLFVKPALSLNELASLCESLQPSPQAKVLEVMLKAPKGILLSKLLEMAAVSRSPLDALIKKKALLAQPLQIDRSLLDDQEYFQTKPKTLNEEQAQALMSIFTSLERRTFETHLIHGVTGSGKTEIYLQAIEYALKIKKGAILLVPEIALTAQTMERLRSRFHEKIIILHHRLSHGERHDAWHHIRKGSAPIVIGARSAIFSPVLNLGLIIVDEEHESSYKQSDEAPCYHARDVAVMRGKLCGATVVLGSATPSLESYYNASVGKYRLSKLTLRADNAQLPQVALIDMRHEFAKAKGFTLFSEALLNSLEKRLKIGEQTLLFLNRRGYHTAQQCAKCSHALVCPHCDISLTHHLGENTLACHLCDYKMMPPRSCPSCGDEEGLKFKGAGTEKVERALHAIFPEVRTLRLDADTTRHKGSHDQLFRQFRSGKADVLIGTQMIAKGLHFPSVTLVGVLNADASLNIPDFRASEQVFQLITQVAGRSGRGTLPGEVLIQTCLLDHPAIALAQAQDYEGFFAQELEVRKTFSYPPFAHLAKLTFSGVNAEKTLATAKKTREILIAALPKSCEIHAAIPCGHAKVKDRFRFQILIKGERIAPLLAEIQNKINFQKEIRISIDIDPLSTYF